MAHARHVNGAPVEAKVSASAAGAALAGVIMWALQTYAFPDGLPEGLQPLLDVAVPALVAFAAGWAAPHTPRTPATEDGDDEDPGPV